MNSNGSFRSSEADNRQRVLLVMATARDSSEIVNVADDAD